MSEQHNSYDVIIVGGSYAGLSAALALGRSLKSTLVIDGGKPCNRFTPASHNFLTQDGQAPAVIATSALEQVKAYDNVKFHSGLAVSGAKEPDGFSIEVDNGTRFFCNRLIFGTGIIDQLPDIPGFSECWGKSVIHCPYCHGYEYRGQKTGIWATVDQAFHLATLVHNLTEDLILFIQGDSQFNKEQLSRLNHRGVALVSADITSISHQNGMIKSIHLANGSSVSLDALYAGVPFTQSSTIPESLGCRLTESGHIEVDAMQKTTEPGIYACGDCTTPLRSVASAVAAGNFAGAVANMELSQAQF